MDRVLITGGAGFIGSHLVERLSTRYRVRVLDNLRSGHRENLRGFDVEFLEGSITDENRVRDAVNGCDTVYHLAALVSVAESMANPQLCVAINTQGLLNVLAASVHAGVQKLVFASSAAVYGDASTGPASEIDTPAPKSPYAVSKLDGEYYCGIFARAHGIETVCLRFFNVFGPRQDPAGPYGAVVPAFIESAIKGEPISISGDGEQTRDFIDVRDIASALHFVARSGIRGVFNVGYGRSISINELARHILTLTGSTSQIRMTAPRPGDVKHSQACTDRIRAIGWVPDSNVVQGLAHTVEIRGCSACNARTGGGFPQRALRT